MSLLSLTALTELQKQESGEVFLILVTVYAEALAEPLRFAHNPGTNVVSAVSGGSETYAGIWMDVVLMGSESGEPPKASVRFDATDQAVLAAIDGLNEQPTIDIDVVLESEPDTAIASQHGLLFSGFSTDGQWLSAELEGPAYFDEVVPGLAMTRDVTPGLFE